METLLRTQRSPVPAQTFFGIAGSMATAPMDCTGGVEDGLEGGAAVDRFPDAAAGRGGEDGEAAHRHGGVTAAMRPLIAAEPMLRAGRPEMVPASNLTGCCPFNAARNKKEAEQKKVRRRQTERRSSH